ncbi:hypothetical protein EMCRGX_G033875 [Ephydatia muelleri]
MSHNGIEECSENDDLLRASGSAVQSHERQCYKLKQRLKNSKQPEAKQVLAQATHLLEELRDLKSKIEGTHFKFSPVAFDPRILSDLKHLVISHTPPTLQDSTKTKIADKIRQLSEGQLKRILFACILTCPWFAHAQTEVSSQARNNILYVVFVSRNEQFFTLAAPHEREMCETVDEGFLFAAEIRHFCWQLQKGNWRNFLELLDPIALLQKSLVDRCLGQAMGGLMKKRKDADGKLVVKEDITPTKFCDSFRLLSYVDCARRRKPISSWVARDQIDGDVLSALRDMFEGHGNRDKLFETFVLLNGSLEKDLTAVPSDILEWPAEIKQWLAGVRLSRTELTILPEPSDADLKKLTEVLSLTRLSGVRPHQVIAVAEAGSHMYGLSTPTSDVDYIIVYKEPMESIISSCGSVKEHMDSRGQKEEVEAAGYEARQFCEMLLKGAVNIFELVFADNITYATEDWKRLVEKKELFLSEQVILQYQGYVKTHLGLIEGGKHTGKPKERKLFYHVLHKLLSLESFVQGKPPVIHCSSEQREYILKIRQGPLEGDLSRDVLLAAVRKRLDAVKTTLCLRDTRIREFGDYRFLQTWLLSVRGVQLEPLQLAAPPLQLATPPLQLAAPPLGDETANGMPAKVDKRVSKS